jgi:hypothetical protein
LPGGDERNVMNTRLVAKYHKLEKELAPLVERMDACEEVNYHCTLELMEEAMHTAKRLGFNRDVDYWQGRIDILQFAKLRQEQKGEH